MFIGRDRELQALEEQYALPGFSMTVIYGRRRVGKTELIKHFIEGKKTIYYMATKVGAERNLELFSKQLISVMDPSYEKAAFSNLEDLFDFFTGKLDSTSAEKLILVIDELPYWAQRDESLLSVIQKYIDTRWLDKNLFIILCGSALSFMQEKVLSEKSPVFGRRSSQIKLAAFDYMKSAEFVLEYSNEEKAICYGVTGGIAKYLSLIDADKPLDENIKRLFFRSDGYLYDEPRNLLTQEFMDTALINNIIEVIAAGENTISLIADKIKEKPQTVIYSIDKLIEVGIVEKKHCITEEKNKKKTQYVLKDGMFRFWYTFVPKATSLIEIGRGDVYYDNVVKPRIHAYMGGIFEEMSRRFTLEQGVTGRFGSFLTDVGTWWGTEMIADEDGKSRPQATDIDVVAISDIDGTAVIGECKFKSERVGKDVYNTLVRRSHLLSDKYRVTRLILFSLSGYTDWVKEIKDEQLTCFTLEDMYKR